MCFIWCTEMGLGREKTPQLARPRTTPPFLRTREPTVWAILRGGEHVSQWDERAVRTVRCRRTLSPRRGCPVGPVWESACCRFAGEIKGEPYNCNEFVEHPGDDIYGEEWECHRAIRDDTIAELGWMDFWVSNFDAEDQPW